MATHWREATKDFLMAVIGDPIDRSLSPHMHNQWLQSRGLPATYTALVVPEAETIAALNHLRELGYLAVNVTTPCKEKAFQWCETTAPAASCSLAVNAVAPQQRCGTQTDGEAIYRLLLETIPLDKRLLVLGAGATGRSILCAIKSSYRVSVWNRSKSRRLPAELTSNTSWLEVRAGTTFDCIVNATSASLESTELDWALDLTTPSTVVIDVRYSPAGLPKWVETARSLGLRAEDGKQLLARQAVLSWKFWLTKCVELREAVSSPPTNADLLRTLT